MNSNTMKKAVVLLAAIAIVLAVCPAVSAGSDEVTIVTSWKDLTDGINAIPADGVGHFSIKGEIKISDAPLEYQKAIEILNGKKIYITGNSYKDTDNATIKPSLNAGNLCNFFKVDSGSLLDIRGESMNTLLKLIGGSAEYGGAIYVGTNGLLSADMLDIEDCNATKDGGAIYFAENYPDAAKEHKISNSTIKNNTADNNGGAIYVGKGSNAPLSQNKIEKNVAQNKGGAVYCCDGSVVRINNSTKTAYIKSNNAHLSGAGVYAENGSTVLVDGTAYIGGNTLLNDGDSSLSGIQDDLHLLSPTTLKLVDNGQYLKDGASINITYEFGSDENLPVQITDDWENAEDCGKYFHSDQGFTVEYVSSTNHNLQLSHTHDNINFSKILTNNYLGTCSGVLSSGNYVLGGPVANNADNITIPSGAVVNLCLNGHLLRGNGEGPTITVENGATLNLYDCYDYDRSSNKSGTWVQYNHYFLNNSDTGLWKHVGETYGSGGTAYYGGVITSKETDTSRPGILNEGTVTIYGGNLFGNASSNGAAIENKGNLTIKGGVIQGNAGEHGVVYNSSDSGNLTVGGTAVIVKNTDGTAKTNYRNVYLQSGKTVDVVNPMRPAYIGVTLENETGNITSEENADYSPYFYCDDSYVSMQHDSNEYFPEDEYSSEDTSDEESSIENSYISSSTDASNKGIEVEKSSGGKYIVKVVLNSDTSNAVKYEYETDGTTTTGYTNTVSDAVSKIPQKGTITLLRNITAQIYANTLIIGSGKDITIDLNGKVLIQPISVDGTLTINDNTSVVHRFSDYNYFWNLAEGSGSHEVTGGVIVAGYASQDFGKTLSSGISVSNGGKVIMNGGNVIGNFVGVNISQNGSFTLNDGTIAGNSASSSNGGGVRDKGSFIMKGGSINHNNARSGNIGAGGISVTNGGSLTMTGGVIEENFALSTSTVDSSVGGVNVSNGSFTMTGGKIINNHAAGNTGGINSSPSPEIGGNAVIKGNTRGDENTNSNYTGNLITVSTATPFSSGAKIWVTISTIPTAENPVEITGRNSADYSTYFRSDDTRYHVIDEVSGEDHTVKLALGNCYSVKYSGGSGVLGEAPVDDKQYISGNTVTVLGKGTLVKDNYNFVGWTDGTNTYKEGDTFTITGDTNLTAVWELVKYYSVKYNGGEGVSGEAPVDSKKYVSGNTVTVLGKGTLVKDNYNFVGWTNGTNTYKEGDTFTITGDTNLTAVWKHQPVKVTFNDNYDGRAYIDPKEKMVIPGEPYGDLPTPTLANFTFGGWYLDTSCTEDKVVTSTTIVAAETDHVLYAKWVGPVVISNTNVNFGTFYEGYEEEIEAVKVFVYNYLTDPVYVYLPTEDNDFTFTPSIAPEESGFIIIPVNGDLTITIKPKENLTAGSHNDSIMVYYQEPSTEYTFDEITVTLTVLPEEKKEQEEKIAIPDMPTVYAMKYEASPGEYKYYIGVEEQDSLYVDTQTNTATISTNAKEPENEVKLTITNVKDISRPELEQPEYAISLNNGDNSQITAEYPTREAQGSSSYSVSIGLKTVSTNLPTLSGENIQEVSSAVSSEGYTPVTMVSALNDSTALESMNENITEDGISIDLKVPSSSIPDENKVHVFHVKEEESEYESEEIEDFEVSEDKEGYRDVTFNGSEFSSYVIAVEKEITPTPSKSSSSSSPTTSFTAVKNGNDFTFTNAVVVTKATLPGAASAKIVNGGTGDGWYKFDLTASGFTGNGTLYFQVPLDVLEVKGWAVNDVGLYHKENGAWVLKPTYLQSTDNLKAYYKATFDSCSPFMINFEEGATATTATETKPVSEEKPATETKKVDTAPVTTNKDDSSSTTQKTTETAKTTTETTKSPFPLIGILAGFGAAVVLIKRRQ